MNSKKDKDNVNVAKVTDKYPKITHKKQSYRKRYDNNHHSFTVTDFFDETPEIDGILYLLTEKMEKRVT